VGKEKNIATAEEARSEELFQGEQGRKPEGEKVLQRKTKSNM